VPQLVHLGLNHTSPISVGTRIAVDQTTGVPLLDLAGAGERELVQLTSIHA